MAHYWKAQAKEVNRGTAPSVGRYAASDARRPETLDSPFGLAGILTGTDLRTFVSDRPAAVQVC